MSEVAKFDPLKTPWPDSCRDGWRLLFKRQIQARTGLDGDELDSCVEAELSNWFEEDEEWRTWLPGDAADENLSYWSE